MSNIIAGRDLRAGQTIIWNDEPHLVLSHSFNKTAMRGGIVKCKIKNLNSQAITIEDFSNKKVTQAIINKRDLLYSYSDPTNIYFMDQESFEEVVLLKEDYKWELNFLEEGVVVKASIYNDQVIALTLPEVVSLSVESVVEDNASSEYKKAITKTKLVVLVPKFFKSTDQVAVTTSDGKYKSR